MEKRYQVFVSSTFVDLQEERREVMQALLELDCIPAGMELFPAADDDQWTLIQRVIDHCDYYVVIVGGRYGTISPTSGLSYTEMEYDYAVSTKKPVLAFVHEAPGDIPASRTEASEDGRRKLDAFKSKVQKKLCKHWKTPKDLGSVVSRSLVQTIKLKPGVGWVRATALASDDAAREILKLKARIEELEAERVLAATSPPPGASDFAQGDDDVEVSYVARWSTGMREWTQSKCVDTTWNELFAHLAPSMIDEASEGVLESELVRFVRDCHVIADGERHHRFTFSKDDFHTILVQLKALGLIMRSERKRPASDRETYWSLTPYGDTLMTRLRAIRRAQEEAA